LTTITAKIIADSISPAGIRLTTMELRYPRMIHSEVMTHRKFSRNARSSRAVPTAKLIEEVTNDPVIPLSIGKNRPGMQAGGDLSDDAAAEVREEWLRASRHTVESAQRLLELSVHKQIVNRVLEPFLHIDVLVSATEWVNFYGLRTDAAAEPHIRMLAEAMFAAHSESEPVPLKPGEWHLPYVSADEYQAIDVTDRIPLGLAHLTTNDIAIRLSVARCARISYRPFDGKADIASELDRHDKLVGASPLHASPAEHQATPDELLEMGSASFKPHPVWEYAQQHGNLTGWRQYRKMIRGENRAPFGRSLPKGVVA
jgi:hypothetical protein